MADLEWKKDRAGEALWKGDEFLGCIYNRDGFAGSRAAHGWRVLAGEDLIPVGDVLPTREEWDARIGARALLEAHVGGSWPLPTASELLSMSDL